MPFVPNPDVARAVINYQQGVRPWVNVLHLSVNSNPTAAALEVLAEQVYNIWTAAFAPLLSETVVFQSCEVYGLASDSAPVGRFVPEFPAEGSVLGDPMPLQSAAVLTLRTNGRGRTARGRIYVSGWSEGNATASSLTPAASAALLTAAETMRAALVANSSPLVVYSQFINNAPRVLGSPRLVSAIELRSAVFGSQRERNKREAQS